MRDDMRKILEALGPGDVLRHEELCRMVGPLPETLRELDVELHPVRRRALRRREIQGVPVWEAIF